MKHLRKILACFIVLALALAACEGDDESSDSSGKETANSVEEGMQAFKAGRYDEAISSYNGALEKQPKAAHIHNLLGMAYRFKYNKNKDQELKEKEIEAFKKAVELEPSFVVAIVNLGSTYYYMGKKKEAAKQFERVLELTPNHPDAERLKKMIAEVGTAEPAAEAGGENKGEVEGEAEEKARGKTD